MLADPKRWRRLLARPRRPSGGRRWPWCRGDDHRRRDGDDLLLVIVVVIVIDLDNYADFDLDLVGVVQLDGITVGFGDGGLRLFLVRVGSGVSWFLGHSGSYVTDG
ncbi:MAG: hypothetical protein ACHQ4F_05125 [Candidatus Dormibacteria bacterium]